MTQEKLYSKCCNATPRVEGENTKYYVCNECNKSCTARRLSSVITKEEVSKFTIYDER